MICSGLLWPGAIGLQHRLLPGREHRDTRRRSRELTRSTPIAEEVRRAIEDEA